MPDGPRSAAAISREHTEHVLRRERQALELLRRELGSEVAGKLDRRLARDIVYDRRRRAVAEQLGAPEEPPARREVMVHLRGITPGAPPVEAGDARRPRRRAQQLRHSARFATDRLTQALTERGGEVVDTFWVTPSIQARVDDEQLTHVVARGDVVNVTVVKPVTSISLDASRPHIRATQVEGNLGFDGTGVTVAVLDTGVDDTHVALSGGVVTGHQDFTGIGTADNVGHGTHCAGIVASRDGKFRGIAPGAQILDLKHLDVTGGTEPAGLNAIQAAVDAGVAVASNSWGASHADGNWQDPPAEGEDDGTCSFCRAADAASDAGVLFVVAAGNDDDDSCATYDTHIGCPGLARLAVTVGASDDDDDMGDFSSIGPTPQGRAKPDLVAPGVDIISARATGTSMGDVVDADWTETDGTSMACPHVAGVAALMLEKNPALAPADVKALLIAATVDIGVTPEEMGAGRIDALDAVNSA